MGERTGEPWACRGCGKSLPPRQPGRGGGRLKQYCGDECRPVCSTEGCGKIAQKLELCDTCYNSVRRAREYGPCVAEGCPKRAVSRHGMCDGHYQQKLYSTKPPCGVDGCPKPQAGGGVCPMHYMRPRREKYGRRDHLARTFGITEAEYDALFEAQGGVCYLCHLPEYKVHPLTGKTFALPVDHNHETGEVRGLLCTNCNSGIGLLGDDPERMLAVVEYLLNPPARLILQRVPDLA